jgi:transposase-like protein
MNQMSHKDNEVIAANGQVGRTELSPEVTPVPRYRQFSLEYKRRIVAEADQCQRGEIAALLRREGLTSSLLYKWRARKAAGFLDEPADSRGQPDRQAQEIERLKRENARLTARLARAEAVIEVQKKLSALLESDEE